MAVILYGLGLQGVSLKMVSIKHFCFFKKKTVLNALFVHLKKLKNEVFIIAWIFENLIVKTRTVNPL